MEKNLPKHECRNFVEKVFLVLDNELSESERRLFIEDIERCKGCLDHYQIELEFKKFVHEKTERKTCAESLKASILKQIHDIQDAE